MRHSPPVLGQLRYSVNDVTFSGVTIPANQTVYIQLASANNDETILRIQEISILEEMICIYIKSEKAVIMEPRVATGI